MRVVGRPGGVARQSETKAQGAAETAFEGLKRSMDKDREKTVETIKKRKV